MNYSQLSHKYYYYYGIIIPPQWSPESCLHRTPQLLQPAQISAMAVLGRSAPHLETHSWLHWKNITWQHLLMKRKRSNSASWPTPIITAIWVWVGGFFPPNRSGIFKATQKLFSWQEPSPAAGQGKVATDNQRVPEGKELHPSSTSSQFLPFSIPWLPRHSSFHIPACPQKAVQLLEGAKLCLAASSCDAECQNGWKPTGEQWRQNLAG